MTFPINLNIGPASLSFHLVFETLAFVIGFRYFLYLRRRADDPIDSQNRIWILIGAAFGAFLFSRLVGNLEDPVALFSQSRPLWFYFANKTIVGALLGGLLGVEITKKIIGVERSSGDLFTYPLILAIMIGRVGCFTAGLTEATYGVPSMLPWAIDLGDGIPRHPLPLYEILFLALLWFSLVQLEKRFRLREGLRFEFFMIAYLGYRLLIGFLKPGFRFDFGLTTIQIVCLLGLMYYGRTLIALFISRSSLLTPRHA